MLTYTIVDSGNLTDTAVVTVTIITVNDPPLAQDDEGNTLEDTAITISVLDNDSDVDISDILTVTTVSQPMYGTATTNGASVIYTPTLNFYGVDVLTYTIADNGNLTDTAVVTITVMGVNDPPIAQDDVVTTLEDIAVLIPVLDNDIDVDITDTLSITAVSQPLSGTANISGTSVIYTPALNFYGLDAFTYTIADGENLTDTATVTITITSVNDAPVALADTAVTLANTSVSVSVLDNDEDVDNTDLMVIAASQPANGQATINGNTVIYTPDVGFVGIEQFTYTVSDGNEEATAIVTISVQSYIIFLPLIQRP
jgi:hypothetical protein